MSNPAEQLVTSFAWSKCETEIAAHFRLEVCELTPRSIELLDEDFIKSDFELNALQSLFENRSALLKKFAIAWYADASGIDYGEEWDPEEGDQQAGLNKNVKYLGIGQGFLVGYAMLFLYAEQRPDDLLDYIKRRKIPSAKKVERDVKRIYKRVTAEKR